MTRSLSVEFRPQTLEEFIGCESVISSIKEGLKQGRIDSTYLFFGPPGCGKTSMARVVARLINGKLEDYDIIEPDTSELGAEEVRSLIEKSHHNPWTGKYKCIIINEAQKLSAPSQTMLLDATEEPPPSTVWFICSSEPNKLSDALRRRGGNYIMPPLNAQQLTTLVLTSVKRIGGDVDMKYLQTANPKTSKAPAYELIDALIKNEVTSPGFILRAVERLITGVPPDEAAQVLEVTVVNTFGIAKEAAKGNWNAIQKLLTAAPVTAGRDIRRAVAGYFRSILMKESLGSQRAERCIWAIETISELANQNQFEDGLIMASTVAALYKICKGQKEYILKKG